MSLIPDHFHPELARYLSARVKLTSSGCLEWQLGVDVAGYGFTECALARKFGTGVVHRLVFACAHGLLAPSPNVVIRQTCNNRRCCNPVHMTETTRAEVIRETSLRPIEGSGRILNSKLTLEQVINIRSSRDPQTHLAKQYGVTPLTIHNIRKRKTWKHVA